MFNKKLINILLKVLGWVTIVCTVLYFVMGFFLAGDYSYDAIEAVGYWIGHQVAGLSMSAFFYALLGVFYRVNNR